MGIPINLGLLTDEQRGRYLNRRTRKELVSIGRDIGMPEWRLVFPLKPEWRTQPLRKDLLIDNIETDLGRSRLAN